MIRRLLIANRGEIAVRIIRTCREMGIETVAVYSTADQESLHVRLADKAVCIGPPPSSQSYLMGNNLIMAALHTGCDAIHPGVGFLSENPGFARLVRDTGLGFIGPKPELIELLGDKVQARATAQRFGLPITPGTKTAVADGAEALEAVQTLGFPVIIKAAAGGGGKGMRVVREEQELAEQLSIAQAEAAAAFADPRVFIERYLENPRHVELQILAAGNAQVAVLGERDCSVQKNHQKLIEESPSPGVSERMRGQMAQGAVKLFQELGYQGAGTIEFLVNQEDFYFMEVNARLQVEHPVSECITGTDMVREQILACTEGRMEIEPQAVRIQGWAMECRINALSPGRITGLHVPGGPGVRFDTCLYAGCMVPPYYDALVGKLIVHGPNRERVLARMDRALAELGIEGIQTNRSEQREIIQESRFRSGSFGTAYYEEREKQRPKECAHAR
ncbi:MAG: acetyl-CoA carboxylase biotin carboxylase subunit [Treponema sp.]|nr:acetyl-CoA carboxylase biotin carboxylase subunit [Treponema sp.]